MCGLALSLLQSGCQAAACGRDPVLVCCCTAVAVMLYLFPQEGCALQQALKPPSEMLDANCI